MKRMWPRLGQLGGKVVVVVPRNTATIPPVVSKIGPLAVRRASPLLIVSYGEWAASAGPEKTCLRVAMPQSLEVCPCALPEICEVPC